MTDQSQLPTDHPFAEHPIAQIARERIVVLDGDYGSLSIGSAIPENPDVVILAQLHALIGSPRQVDLPHIDAVPAYAKLANGQLSPHQSLSILEEAEADVREIRGLISGA